MNGSLVLAIALAGFGGQNPPAAEVEPLPLVSPITSPYTNPYPEYTSPSSYSGYYARPNTNVDPLYASHGEALHALIYSMFVGRDPNIPTTAQIEASVYGDAPGH
jgi:hypothetical protein